MQLLNQCSDDTKRKKWSQLNTEQRTVDPEKGEG